MNELTSTFEALDQLELQDGDSDSPRSFVPWAIVAIAVVALPLITYLVVINDFAAALTGTIYTQDEYQAGIDESHLSGFAAGESQGYDEGERVGYAAGHESGVSVGYESGYEAGDMSGQEVGYDAGRAAGYSSGTNAGYERGFREGNEEGLSNGYVRGYNEGFSEGCEALFDGLETDRVGDWWDFYYGSTYGSYYERLGCYTLWRWPSDFDFDFSG